MQLTLSCYAWIVNPRVSKDSQDAVVQYSDCYGAYFEDT